MAKAKDDGGQDDGQEQGAGLPDAGSAAAVAQQAATDGSMLGTTRAEQEPPEPEVLAERGGFVLKLGDWTLHAFETTLAETGQAVVVTRTGLRVTREQADEIQAAARAHGVELTEEKL